MALAQLLALLAVEALTAVGMALALVLAVVVVALALALALVLAALVLVLALALVRLLVLALALLLVQVLVMPLMQVLLSAASLKPAYWRSVHGRSRYIAGYGPRTNGATHMGNDDNLVFDGLAHIRIVDVSCPRQMLAIMQWIMAGNKGLMYIRVMRTGSAVIYGPDYVFDFGVGHVLRRADADEAIVISSGKPRPMQSAATSNDCIAVLCSRFASMLVRLVSTVFRCFFTNFVSQSLLNKIIVICQRHEKGPIVKRTIKSFLPKCRIN